jgi:hypothetical protein
VASVSICIRLVLTVLLSARDCTVGMHQALGGDRGSELVRSINKEHEIILLFDPFYIRESSISWNDLALVITKRQISLMHSTLLSGSVTSCNPKL